MNTEKILGSTLFVVDDNLNNLEFFTEFFDSYGYKILTFQNGEEMLEQIKCKLPDLILLDIMMPHSMDGYEVCTLLKAHPIIKDIPVIFMSALTDSLDKVKGFNLGAVDFISKPIEPEEVISRISTHLKFSQLQKELKETNQNLEKIVEDRTIELVRINEALKSKIAEKELTEKKYRDIFESATEGIYQSTPDGKFITVNPALAKIFAYDSPEDFLSNISDIRRSLYFNPMKRDEFNVLMEKNGFVKGFEFESYRKDGEIIILTENSHVVRDRAGKILYYEGRLEDVTEKKLSETELENTKNYLKNVFNSLSSMLISINPEEIITEWNLACEKYTGITFDNAVSKPIWEILPFLYRFREKIERSIQTKNVEEILNESVEYKGKKYFNISIYPLTQNSIDGAVIRIDDITESAIKDEQLRQAQKMEVIGNLAGGLAHDFNNVLGGIVGIVSLIRYNLNKNKKIEIEDLKTKISLIDDASKRASDMVKRLLTLARKQELFFMPIDLNLILKNVLKICENTFDKSVELIYKPFGSSAYVIADLTQIEQVLLNLCLNASHAMTIMRPPNQRQGGKLMISIDKITADKYFSLTHEGAAEGKNYWIISLSDNGVGMDSKIMSKIFDPFFTTKEKFKGSGLGLAMVYSILNQHKGFIDVYSELGIGSTFNIYLPELDSKDIIKEYNKDDENIQYGQGLILVIDDEEVMRQTAKSILEECGYDVLLAKNGEEGILILTDKFKDINLVILDMSMPKMSGKETYLKMKSIDPDIKVLLVSGFRQDERIQDVLDLGISGFIQKPYSMVDLAKKVKGLI